MEQEIISLINQTIQKKNEKIKEYLYDSLCLRYNVARDAQMRAELQSAKSSTEIDNIVKLAKRDKLRFYEILQDLMSEEYYDIN